MRMHAHTRSSWRFIRWCSIWAIIDAKVSMQRNTFFLSRIYQRLVCIKYMYVYTYLCMYIYTQCIQVHESCDTNGCVVSPT